MSGLLARLRAAEAQWAADRGALQLALKGARQRAQRCEVAARRAEEQRDFRVGEVRHLKAALDRRDAVITGLQDEVRELEVGVAAAEAVQRAEGDPQQQRLNTAQRVYLHRRQRAASIQSLADLGR